MPREIAVTCAEHIAESLRMPASSHKFRDCRHRLRAMALMIEDNVSSAEISRRAGVDVQTLRDWVIRYNGSGVDGLRDAPRPGRSPKLDESRTLQLVPWIDAGPDPEANEPSCLAVAMIREWIKRRFDVDFTAQRMCPCFTVPVFGMCPHGRSMPGRTPEIRRVYGVV